MNADKAKRMLLGIQIDRDELAFRIAQGALGMKAPPFTVASKALDDMDALGGDDPRMPLMGEGFRRAADRAVAYFHECIQDGRAPH